MPPKRLARIFRHGAERVGYCSSVGQQPYFAFRREASENRAQCPLGPFIRLNPRARCAKDARAINRQRYVGGRTSAGVRYGKVIWRGVSATDLRLEIATNDRAVRLSPTAPGESE